MSNILYKDLSKSTDSDTNNHLDIKLSIITDERGFKNLKGSWNRLTKLADTPVYVSFEWLITWWKHFGRHPKRKLFIILCYAGDELVGIAPCYIGVSKLGAVTIQKRLCLMGCGTGRNELLGFSEDYGYSDFLDIIANPNYEDAIAEKLVTYFITNHEAFDKICFNHVRDDSFIVRRILPFMEMQKLHYDLLKTDECTYIQLPESLEKYINQLGSSSRRRRFRKKLKPVGKQYDVEEVNTLSDARENLALLCKLHQEQWNSLGFPGVFFDDRQRNFFRDINELAFKNGWLWFRIARDKEGVSALRWALKYNNRFFDCYTAYSFTAPSSQYAPGLGLLALLIEDAISMKATTVELLRGTERYKFDFTKKSHYNWKISLNLYQYKPKFYSAINNMLYVASKVYTSINNEMILIKTHKEKVGIWKMLFSYGAFRVDRLRQKLKSNH